MAIRAGAFYGWGNAPWRFAPGVGYEHAAGVAEVNQGYEHGGENFWFEYQYDFMVRNMFTAAVRWYPVGAWPRTCVWAGAARCSVRGEYEYESDLCPGPSYTYDARWMSMRVLAGGTVAVRLADAFGFAAAARVGFKAGILNGNDAGHDPSVTVSLYVGPAFMF